MLGSMDREYEAVYLEYVSLIVSCYSLEGSGRAGGIAKKIF